MQLPSDCLQVPMRLGSARKKHILHAHRLHNLTNKVILSSCATMNGLLTSTCTY